MTADEFGSHTQSDALRDLIAAEIAAAGRITFRRFMELALYHPTHGYYASREEVIGRRGDYLTSPELSPLFGAMAGRQVAEIWRLLGSPASFTLVEAGPGNGTMAADLLRWAARAEPDLRRALAYVLVERAPAQEARQRRLLGGEAGVRWAQALPAHITGCIVANELLDAFPVHLVAMQGGGLREAYVILCDGAFREVWGPPSADELAAYFDALGMHPGEGCRAEVNLDAPRWVAAAGQALARGAMLTLDYGYPAARLYAPWRRQGTLLCFTRHTAHDDPYARVGRQDITAHIDFSSAARAGLAAGLDLAGFTSQHEFLTALGIHEALRLPDGGTPGEEYFARHRAVNDLLDPAGLGRVRVLAMTKGLPAAFLRGFSGVPNPRFALFGGREDG